MYMKLESNIKLKSLGKFLMLSNLFDVMALLKIHYKFGLYVYTLCIYIYTRYNIKY